MKLRYLIAIIAVAFVGALTANFANAAEANWTTDYNVALVKAKAEHKNVLLDFTGSDWCPWCIKLDKDVYEKPAFIEFAKKNLILVTVDFPQSKKLPANVKKQNDMLQEKFQVQGFPTTVILDSNGKTLGGFSGYIEGGPTAFIAKVKEIEAKPTDKIEE